MAKSQSVKSGRERTEVAARLNVRVALARLEAARAAEVVQHADARQAAGRVVVLATAELNRAVGRRQ